MVYFSVQMLMPVISLAFLIVIASTAMYTPLLLYVFDLRKVGWLWEHGALFSAMISSTDAVAVSAILKKGEALLACACYSFPLRMWGTLAKCVCRDAMSILHNCATDCDVIHMTCT